MLKDKNVVIGVCGGIACYKVATLVGLFKKEQANVNVIMTKNATEFVSPLTFQTLSQNAVVTDMFKKVDNAEVKHISLAQKADIIVIAPATANIIGKIVNGIADDMLSTVIMASKCPVLVAPAMNNVMYENPILKDNIKKLKKYGYFFVDAQIGHLACGTTAVGKLAEPEKILAQAKEILK